VTVNRATVTEQRDTSANLSVTLSRAHAPPYGGDVTLSRVTHADRDSDSQRDSDSAPAFGSAPSPSRPAPLSRIEHDKARFANDPRFGQWVALGFAPTPDANLVRPDGWAEHLLCPLCEAL
jgi:hypothetical protein